MSPKEATKKLLATVKSATLEEVQTALNRVVVSNVLAHGVDLFVAKKLSKIGVTLETLQELDFFYFFHIAVYFLRAQADLSS